MKKGKKKNKKNLTLYNKIKSSIPNNRVLYSILGGVGAGVALSSALGKEKRQAMLNKVTGTFQGLRRPAAITDPNRTTEARIAVG